jgi:predicted RNA-binding Zn-ribbon protein involved in translation (DUF1610 family)
VKCPKCGWETQPLRTWHLTSPLPDSEGRITITIMGSFKCPKCGYSWRGRVSVLRVGGEHDVEVGNSKKSPKKREESRRDEHRESKVIEIDVREALSEEE